MDDKSCTVVDRLSIGVSELIPATGVEAAFVEPTFSVSSSLFLFAPLEGPAFGVPTDPSFSRRIFPALVSCRYFFFILSAAGDGY